VAVERQVIEAAIQAGLADMKAKAIHGQEVTPYLLRRVSELTNGRSLQANLGLLHNNARIAAEVAHYLYQK
jgi:pseudouridine-5'-phosphate glycosidase